MRVNTAIGECLAEYNGQDYIVRPCFRALNTIDELEESISSVCSAYNVLLSGGAVSVQQISVCAYVLQCCSDLPDHIVGWNEYRNGKFKWFKKVLTINEIVIMAHHCIKWGVFGEPKEKLSRAAKKELDKKADSPFDPHDFVAVLVDEFHLSSNDAWSATMVEFQRLCEHRNRKNWGDRPEPVTDEERDDLIKHYRDAMKRKQELNNNG